MRSRQWHLWALMAMHVTGISNPPVGLKTAGGDLGWFRDRRAGVALPRRELLIVDGQ